MSYPINELAQALYRGWCQYELTTANVAHPKWFALRKDYKAHWHRVAEETLRLYAEAEWDDALAAGVDTDALLTSPPTRQ